MSAKKSYPSLKRCLVLILLCILTLCFAACGSYLDPKTSGGGSHSSGGALEDEEAPFAVDLVLSGKQYTPPIEMYAQWTGTDGIYKAKFDQNGHAEIRGLDGDYHVTLSALPTGYTYDPNGYTADNNHRSVEIEMLQIIPTTGAGAGMYSSIRINRLGTYRTTLNSASHAVFYEYAPTMQGRYSIQSWVDISENEINPIMEVYYGSTQFKYFAYTQDGGGASSTYTKNFKLALELTSDMVGNVWTFQAHADCRSGVYPITIDFTIRYESDYQGDDTDYRNYTNYYATGPFYDASLHGTVSGHKRLIYADTNNVLDASVVALNPADGFYHVYNETRYASSGGFGPLLFAYLGKDGGMLSTASGSGFLDEQIRGWLRFNGKRYWWDIPVVGSNGREQWVTDPDCFLAQYVSHGVDGGHPVTEELKEFLFGWSLQQGYFNDGDGWAEARGLKSNEENQWLYNCYYYA